MFLLLKRSSRQGQVNYFKLICGTCALSLICTNMIVYYKNMQRRDSLGLTTRIPRLSTLSTQKFKTRRRQPSFSSVSDVFADNGATKGQVGFSVSLNETEKQEKPRWQSRANC